MKTRIIHTKFWSDDFVNTLTHKEKLLFCYLMTNDKVSLTGMYELPGRYIKADLELTDKELEQAKKKLSESGKVLFHGSWIKLVNHDKFNNFSGKKLSIAKEKELNSIPTELTGYQYPIDTSIDTSMDTLNKDNHNHNHKDKDNNKDRDNNKKKNIEVIKAEIRKSIKRNERKDADGA